MRYQIVYDTPGRIRVRCGAYAFSQEQGCGIASLLLARQGVTDVAVSAANGSILICYRPGWREDLLQTVAGLQKESLPTGKSPDRDSIHTVDNRFRRQLARLCIRRFILRPFLPATVRIAVTFWRALGYWHRALESLLHGRIDVAVLDGASVAAAVSQRRFGTASSIMFLLSLSELLEDYTRHRTKNALTRNLAVQVDRVWLCQRDGAEVLIPLSQLSVGDRVRVRTGAVIPVDGTIIDGEAAVNESSMTGEPLAVLRRAGSTVYAGTVVEEGSVIIETDALPDETRVSRIIDLIDRSEELKASVQSQAEHLADAIVPLSFLGALGVWAVTRNLSKTLSVLMVDYSCAIKLATPICIISAMREASSQGIMIKGGKYLEAFAQADTMVLDKTGTLTEACPKVMQVLSFRGYSRDEVLKIAACLEEHFPHSMARAVVRAAREQGLCHEEEHAEVEYVVAHGIATMLHGRRALIGSYHFIVEDEKILLTAQEQERIFSEGAGCSLLYLAIGGELAGVLCIHDPPRQDAAEVISALHEMGITRTIMLTGDNAQSAESICRQLGICEFYAQVLPGDKASLIESFKQGGHKVIMVGDGVNDSPALAAADVSVAMKEGSDIAREVADIALLSSDLRNLVVLRRLSQELFQRVHANYRFILGFNTLLLLLGLTGAVAPSAAALLHNASTMALSASSMRPLLWEKQKKDTKGIAGEGKDETT